MTVIDYSLPSSEPRLFVWGWQSPLFFYSGLDGTSRHFFADNLIKWHRDYIKTDDGAGTKDPVAQKSGAIEFLTPDRKKTIFKINLYEVGLAFIGVEPSKANDDAVKRLKFELYVHRMDIDGSGMLGVA